MTLARSSQVDLTVTPYYHLISRCVRRAFLCGVDRDSGKSFEHRKQWLVDRIRFLGEVFAVDVCAYAVMSNHFHLVVRMVRERAGAWTDDDVCQRYAKLFPASVRMLRNLGKRERARRIELYRQRLCDVSWMMRAINEWVARQANKEDKCKGRFWEGRFKSQALLDERALLTCMSYVDLNPVRAGIATSLEASEFTSIEERLREVAARGKKKLATRSKRQPRSPLAPFQDQARLRATKRGTGRKSVPFAERLPMLFADYVELLDWTGRALLPHKRGAIRGAPPRALVAAKIDTERWLTTMRGMNACFGNATAIGECENLVHHAEARGMTKVRGRAWAKGLYGVAA